MDELEQLVLSAPERVDAATDLDQLKDLEGVLVGRASKLAELRRGLGGLPAEERPVVGVRLNEVAAHFQELLERKRRTLERHAEDRLLEEDRVDVTVPKVRLREGTAHLLTSTIDEVVDIFTAIGYRIATGPEVETGFHNFDALNTPKDHLENEPPTYVLVPGRVFRSDDLDPTHSPVFHQIEGLAVDTHISLTDLKGTLEHFANEFFGKGRRIKLIPHFFPFTEPSAEMHVSCFACDGSGCRVCGNVGWIELMGCGMVDPNVLEAVDYDPDRLSGFAFGMGVERLAMVRHGITHIRHFFENDLRVLGQFV